MDDDLAARFSSLALDVHQHLRLAPPPRIRAAGDRRRARALAAVTGVAAGVTALVAGTTAAVLSPAQPPSPPPAGLPPSFTLPHEGEPGWRRDDSPLTPLAFSRCVTRSDPTLVGRTDVRTVSAVDLSTVEQVFVFRDEAAARDAMVTVMRQCQVATYPDDSSGFASFGTDNITQTADQIGRRGNVIFYTSMRGPVGSGVEDASRSLMSALADLLCEEMALCGGPGWSPPTAPVSPSPGASGAHPR